MTGNKAEKFKVYWESRLDEKEKMENWIQQLPIDDEAKKDLREFFGLGEEEESNTEVE